MRRTLIFLAALVVFTIFGQGRLHQWTYIATDTEQCRYLLDEHSLHQVGPTTWTFLLRKDGPKGTAQSRFTLDLKAHTLQKDGEPSQPIVHGTVAAILQSELVHRSEPQK